jgi:holo-[acyl-carrier protein] synthase
MKIIGIGVDIIDNNRIKKSIKNQNFIKRVYTAKEINTSKSVKNRVNFYAKRFAAKEAFVKALGIGFRKNLNFKDIEILNDNLGKPYYNMNNKIKKILKKISNSKSLDLFLSLSDEKSYSIAFATIQKK